MLWKKYRGYSIVRIKINENGAFEEPEDFITGWLKNNGALGRPVDILINERGDIMISDDKAGVVYLIREAKP